MNRSSRFSPAEGMPSAAPRCVLATCLLISLFLWGPCPAGAQGQPGRAEPPPLRFHRLTLEDGLSQGHIRDITQDPRGYLWIATGSGLNRYDGHSFRVYAPDPFDPTSLSDGTVHDVHIGRGGALWVATSFGGLNRLDLRTDTATRYQHDPNNPNSLSSGKATAVYEDEQGGIWVGTTTGLNRMRPGRPGRFTRYRHRPDDPHSLSNNRIRSISGGPDGTLWVATANGLNRMDLDRPGHFDRLLHGPGSPDAVSPVPGRSLHRQHVSPDAPDVRWIGSDNGIVRLNTADGSTERFRPHPDQGPSANIVKTASPDPSAAGVLWIPITNEGLARFDPATETFLHYRSAPEDRHGLVEHAGSVTFTDRSGMVWVGSDGGGLSKLNPAAIDVAHYTETPAGRLGLRTPSVWGLGATDDGAIWAGAEEGYLHRLDPATGRVRVWQAAPDASLAPTRPAGTAYDFAEGRNETLWIGTGRGLDRYDPATGRFAHYRHDPDNPNSLSNHNINYLYREPDGPLWIATFEGLNRYEPASDTFTRYLHDPSDSTGLASDWVGAVHQDQRGRLWVATRNAVSRLDPATGRFTHYRHDPDDPSTLTTGRFAWIHERAREPGVLWIASIDGGGLDRLDTRTGAVTHYTTETSGLPDNTVYAIQEDDAGRLWLSTNHGLIRFNPDAPAPHSAFRQFGPANGLQGLEFNQHAAARGPDGTLYFGGVNGLNAFRPEAFDGNTVPPLVSLTHLKVLGPTPLAHSDSVLQQAIGADAAVALAHDQNQITFGFVGLHFKAPALNRYRYRLSGYDEGWIEAGTRREATYTNLPPGTYRFEVRAANADGVWSTTAAAVQLRIAPPWWRTWGAYGVYGLLLAGGVVGAFYLQRRRLERRQRELEATVADRTGALRREKQKTEQQAERLRAMDRLKSRFFTNVSHEFRTPLTLTIGPLEDLQEALAEADEGANENAPGTPPSSPNPSSLEDSSLRAMIRENVDRALRNSRRLLRLIGQLLDTAKLEAGELTLDAERADLAAFVRALARTFVPLAERRRIRFTVEAPQAAVPVAFDDTKLEKVLTNLLSNAFKFTPVGGTIHVAVSVAVADGEAQVAVEDSGPGIPDAEQPHLFERFYQTETPRSEVQSGSGIGLSLAHDLAELHGGTITVESEAGQGSIFTVHLPLHAPSPHGTAPTSSTPPPRTTLLAPGPEDAGDRAPPNAPSDDAPSAPAPPAPAADDRTTLLIADDNPEIRAYVRSHFAPRYRVLEATDGRAALQTARRALPDLIISDVMMPRLDGVDLVEALRTDPETDFLPVILLTARATEADKIEGLREGADAYLTKPFNVRELQVRVENLIASRQRLKDRFAPTEAPTPVPAPDDLSPSEADYLERARSAVEAHLSDEDFGVQALADALEQSRSTLYRRLRDLVDQSPSTFIREIRLAQAALLLRDGRGTVSEVAYAVGFKSVSHFSQAFRDTYDVVPSAYADEAPEAS